MYSFMSDNNAGVDIDALIDELHDLHAEFETQVDDAYRQSRVDVAISQLEECKQMKDDYKNANMWGEQ